MNDLIIKVSNISKSYRSYTSQWNRFLGWFGRMQGFVDHWILRDVDFSIRRGESIGILGRNGAGKSTLLKMIAGTLEPTTGEIEVNGKITAILELGMGFNQEFTARQNVLYACGLMGYAREEILLAMPAIESFADIGEYFDQPMRAYSSGMQMRVAFASATAFRPDVLIIDEALSVGDLSFQAKCFERIAQLRASGTTLLYVSHAVSEVVKHCERCLYIKDRRVALDGPSRDISNIYLDDLFGRGSGAVEDPVSLQGGDEFSGDLEDRFHTRPYYRADEYRWGHGGARIVDYRLSADSLEFPVVLHSGQDCRVSFKVVFERLVERAVFGLLIKSHDGVFLYGTNSRLSGEEGRGDIYKTGSSVVATFEFPWQFNAGAHLMSFGVSEEQGEGELVPLDRRYDSLLLTTANVGTGSGLLDLGASFSISKTEAA
jgi:lipopolysaccharide transport system ATP-binding protein